jgi:hypothetical protein
MTMRTVPTKEMFDDGVEDVHSQVVKQIQRGRKFLKFEQTMAEKKKSEDGS